MDSLLRRARREGAPLIDGDQVTFVRRSATPVQLMGDFNDWDSDRPIAMQETAPGLWTHTLTLPADAYVEYDFFSPAGKRVHDLLNPRRTYNGVNAWNHYFYTPEATPSHWTEAPPEGLRGSISRHVVSERVAPLVVGGRRDVYLYRPAAGGPYPLLVVLDGNDYLKRGKLVEIVDNLIAARRIAPLALALVENDKQARLVEYACSEATIGFMLDGVIPLAGAVLDLVDIERQPGAYGIMGASMGGLMALFAGLRIPTVFGKVLSQSCGFGPGARDSVLCDLVRYAPLAPLAIWMGVGKLEWLLAVNRRLRDLFEERGYSLAGYHEYNGGHNYTSWANAAHRGLQALFGTSTE